MGPESAKMVQIAGFRGFWIYPFLTKIPFAGSGGVGARQNFRGVVGSWSPELFNRGLRPPQRLTLRSSGPKKKILKEHGNVHRPKLHLWVLGVPERGKIFGEKLEILGYIPKKKSLKNSKNSRSYKNFKIRFFFRSR